MSDASELVQGWIALNNEDAMEDIVDGPFYCIVPTYLSQKGSIRPVSQSILTAGCHQSSGASSYCRYRISKRERSSSPRNMEGDLTTTLH
jgi:hypothetical protein